MTTQRLNDGITFPHAGGKPDDMTLVLAALVDSSPEPVPGGASNPPE